MAEQTIYWLAYEITELRIKLAVPADSAPADPSEAPEDIACLAAGFARQLAAVRGVRATTDKDAATVNAHISMIAEEADSLIWALIQDAEAHDLEATGPWLRIPLVECRAFELPDPGNRDHAEADDFRDQQLNS